MLSDRHRRVSPPQHDPPVFLPPDSDPPPGEKQQRSTENERERERRVQGLVKDWYDTHSTAVRAMPTGALEDIIAFVDQQMRHESSMLTADPCGDLER